MCCQDYQEAREAKEDMDGRDFMGRPVGLHFVAADDALQYACLLTCMLLLDNSFSDFIQNTQVEVVFAQQRRKTADQMRSVSPKSCFHFAVCCTHSAFLFHKQMYLIFSPFVVSPQSSYGQRDEPYRRRDRRSFSPRRGGGGGGRSRSRSPPRRRSRSRSPPPR